MCSDCYTLSMIGIFSVEARHFEPLKIRTLLYNTVAHLSGEDQVSCCQNINCQKWSTI